MLTRGRPPAGRVLLAGWQPYEPYAPGCPVGLTWSVCYTPRPARWRPTSHSKATITMAQRTGCTVSPRTAAIATMTTATRISVNIFRLYPAQDGGKHGRGHK